LHIVGTFCFELKKYTLVWWICVDIMYSHICYWTMYACQVNFYMNDLRCYKIVIKKILMTIMIIYLQKCFRAANFIILNSYFSAKNQNQLLLVTDSSFHALTMLHEIGTIWLVAHNLNNLHSDSIAIINYQEISL